MKLTQTTTLPDVSTTHSGVGSKKVIFSEGQIPHLQQLGRVTFQSGETVAPHSHTDFSEIMYIEDGEATMKVDDNEFPISKGSCIAVEPNEIHTITVTGDKPLILLFWGIYTK